MVVLITQNYFDLLIAPVHFMAISFLLHEENTSNLILAIIHLIHDLGQTLLYYISTTINYTAKCFISVDSKVQNSANLSS